MSAPTLTPPLAAQPATGPGAPRLGGLLRAELRRITARRFVRALLVLLLLGFLAGVVITALSHSRLSPALLAEAEQRRAESVAMEQQFREECLREAERVGESPEMFCGPAPNAEEIPLEAFVDKAPFELAGSLPIGAIAVGVGTAALLFLLGATYIGAEWSTRSMAALLTWEPRRLRVFASKLAVLAVFAVLVALVMQLLWVAAGWLIAATRGTTERGPDFWGDLLAQQGRVLLLGVLAAGGGFALAHLIRNTGAALGIGFVYFAIVENVVRATRPAWQEWLVSTNVLALLMDGGFTYGLPVEEVTGEGIMVDYVEKTVSSLQGGVFLTAVVVAVLTLGALAFRRSDVS